MHSIVHGLLPILEQMARHPAIDQITPGRISANRRAADSNITLQYYTDAGCKLLARTPSTIQEVFIVTSEPEEVHRWLISEGLIREGQSNDTQSAETAQTDKPANSKTPSKSPSQAEPRAKKAPTSSATGKNRGKKPTNLGVYADYLYNDDAPNSLDAPTDELLVVDHLKGDVTAKLRKLRDQAAAAEQNNTASNTSSGAVRSGAKPKSTSTGKAAKSATSAKQTAGPAPSQKSNKSAVQSAKKAQANQKTNQEANPLAAWLAQSDDQTFQRLANKYKGGDR